MKTTPQCQAKGEHWNCPANNPRSNVECWCDCHDWDAKGSRK